MRTIQFTEKEVTQRGVISDKKITISSVDLVSTIDNGKVLIAIVMVNKRSRALYLCGEQNYKLLASWTEQEIDNKIVELLN